MYYHIDAAGVYFVLMLGHSNKGSCLSEKKKQPVSKFQFHKLAKIKQMYF